MVLTKLWNVTSNYNSWILNYSFCSVLGDGIAKNLWDWKENGGAVERNCLNKERDVAI